MSFSHEALLKAVRATGSLESVLKLSSGKTLKLYGRYLNFMSAHIMRFLGTNISFVRAAGNRLWDDQGNEYLDFFSGFGALNLGHEPPEVLEALRLVENHPNLLQSAPNPCAAKLAELLALITPGALQRSFFCSSGAEAVEAALKLARIATGRTVLLATEGAYHGKTFGALSVSGRQKYKKHFLPLLPETEQIAYDDPGALESRLQKGDVAGFIVEPIQGENGVILPHPGYLQKASALCRQYGTLLLVDEIQTGFGRTGRLFACEHEGIEPDILILSKSLGGGVMPIGAIVTTDAIWKKAYGTMDTALLHSTTFGGNTRACMAGLAAIHALVEKDLIRNAEIQGHYLLEGLRRLQQKHAELVREVRGRGLMLGMTFARVKGGSSLLEGALTLWISRRLLKKHRILVIFTLNNYDILRIAPPLTITRKEVDVFLEAFEDVLKSSRPLTLLPLTQRGS